MYHKLYKFIAAIGVLAILGIFFSSCIHKQDVYTPKPMGYFRINIPEHSYKQIDTIIPFTFEQSKLANLSIQKRPDGAYWIDIDYPDFNASFKCTYFPMHHADSLRELILKEERMVKFHYQKADDVEYSIIKDADDHLWGQLYDIAGKEVATPFQFWMTDSASHFLRATLYFNFTPNNDSLKPVIDFLREDAMHLIGTFAWK